MTRAIRTSEDLEVAAAAGMATLYPRRLKILVGASSCGLAVGAGEVELAAAQAVKDLRLDANVTRTGCIGFCSQEPLLDLMLPGGPRVSFGTMTPSKTRELLAGYARDGRLAADLAIGRFEREEHVSTGQMHEYPQCPADLAVVPEWSQLPFWRRQKKIILRNCGSVDPMSIDEAIARGTYRGALRALTQLKPEEALAEVTKSGLRGRGGASFPTGLKWRLARETHADIRYIVCNADEGAPGAYMDRTILEGDPHAILEGMLIGSYAIGACEGFIYVRSEYPLAIQILEHAIAEAQASGLLGSDIFGSGWSFRVTVRRGAGAYVCGEETGLIESIEGHSGEPRSRPPYPVTQGLWGKPTVVNNVKTWASVAPILTRGSAWYASMGTAGTKGTTVFSLEGAVKNAGLVEVPFGISLRDMIYDIGGGTRGGRPLKAVQAGGPSTGCIPPSLLDLPIDSDDGSGQAAVTGTGGIIVLDDGACMVDMARFLLGFFADESCGKCSPCREGTRQMLEILTRIARGQGRDEDIPLLERLSRTMSAAASCGLGATGSGPVTAALEYFRDEVQAHIREKRCPAGICAIGTDDPAQLAPLTRE